MTAKKFIQNIDRQQIVDKIGEVEQSTSANVVVRIGRWHFGDHMAAAKKRFLAEGLHKHPMRNCVMLHIMPAKRSVVILGDVEVDKVMDSKDHGHTVHCWESIVADCALEMPTDPTAAILEALHRIGLELALSFPPTEKRDNIPNTVEIH